MVRRTDMTKITTCGCVCGVGGVCWGSQARVEYRETVAQQQNGRNGMRGPYLNGTQPRTHREREDGRKGMRGPYLDRRELEGHVFAHDPSGDDEEGDDEEGHLSLLVFFGGGSCCCWWW